MTSTVDLVRIQNRLKATSTDVTPPSLRQQVIELLENQGYKKNETVYASDAFLAYQTQERKLELGSYGNGFQTFIQRPNESMVNFVLLVSIKKKNVEELLVAGFSETLSNIRSKITKMAPIPSVTAQEFLDTIGTEQAPDFFASLQRRNPVSGQNGTLPQLKQ